MLIKEIPNSDGYSISETGVVFDNDGNIRNQYTNGDGYKTARIPFKDGKSRTMGVHRLVALSHIPREREDRNEVNHRDCNITNNCVSNLEWVTAMENNIHSELYRGNFVRNNLVIYKKGIPHDVAPSLKRAGIITNLQPLEVWDLLKENQINKDGYSFEYLREGRAIPKSLRKPIENRGFAKTIKTKDVVTGEVLYFPTMISAAKHHGTVLNGLWQAVQKRDKPRLLHKRYQVAHGDDDFPVFSEEDILESMMRGSKKVFAINVETMEEIITDSAADFIRKTGLSKKAVTVALRNSIIRRVGDWLFMYYDEVNVERIRNLVLSPDGT